MWKKLISVFLIFSIFSFSLFAADDHTPEEFNKNEIPQSLKDLRRFEIITLGSMPFVMMDTTLIYSGIMTGTGQLNANGVPYKVTPFATDSCFTWEQDQLKILAISVSVCVGIGLTDLIVRVVKRSSKTKKISKPTNKKIQITPLSEDPDAILIKLPEAAEQNSENEIEIESSEESESDEVEEVTGD